MSQVVSGSRLLQNKSCVKILGGSTVYPSKKTIESGVVGAKPAKPKARSDPVSLFQKTQSAWKSSRFLKSGANNK